MDIAQQLQTSLSTTTIPTPSLAWLRALAASRSQPPGAPPPPLASLLATARARLLAADLTAPGLLDPGYAAAHALPAGLAAQRDAAQQRLPRDAVVQVLDVEDVARPRWEQVEELEALARGEGTRGREVVRLPPAAAGAGGAGGAGEEGDDGVDYGTIDGGDEDDGDGYGQGQQQGQPRRQQQHRQHHQQESGSRKNATHKLVLQDCKGQKVYALELKRVEQIGVGKTCIGEKLLLRAGTIAARGIVMLEPGQCVVLGGKVEVWHRAWVEGRLARLKEAVKAGER